MLTRLNPAAALDGGAAARPAAGQIQAGASDAFSQQLLSILNNGLERLSASPAAVKVVRAEGPAAEATAEDSTRRQDVVAVASSGVSEPRTAEKACGNAGEATPTTSPEAAAGDAMPEVLFEHHDGWNWRNYATYEMAEWLARRLGGEVGTYKADWSPGFEPPPDYYTVRFGGIEMNAGQLAIYYQPGDYVEPDRMAAMLMAGEGVNNSFVSEHFPELSRA